MRHDKAHRVGLWLDRSGATIVTLDDDGEPVVRQLKSNVDSHYRLSGGSKSGARSQDVANEKGIDRKHEQQLARYYERLMEALGEAERVLILGPGEAKNGFERALKEERRAEPRSVTVTTADKMTDNQIVAAVRKFYAGKHTKKP